MNYSQPNYIVNLHIVLDNYIEILAISIVSPTMHSAIIVSLPYEHTLLIISYYGKWQHFSG